ncbi:hypothetical protein PsorP6_007831 [Peronosclerospora sorghi]|uniref:Uncharacterized protein n=1 Tax=Peronosclerospora sorghi TaxID=230839 RepID=A0ACC0W9J4_9STRA|nr:hypothetical protein PsorP6_007831 [Peronosclerospora sorghi]
MFALNSITEEILIACFAAASAQVAIQSTDAAALIVDQSNHQVDRREHRNLRTKVPDGSEDERVGLSQAEFQVIENASREWLDQLLKLQDDNLLNRLTIALQNDNFRNKLCIALQDDDFLNRISSALQDAYECYEKIQSIRPYNELHPEARALMDLGEVYFKRWFVNDPSAVNALPQKHPNIEAKLRLALST